MKPSTTWFAIGTIVATAPFCLLSDRPAKQRAKPCNFAGTLFNFGFSHIVRICSMLLLPYSKTAILSSRWTGHSPWNVLPPPPLPPVAARVRAAVLFTIRMDSVTFVGGMLSRRPSKVECAAFVASLPLGMKNSGCEHDECDWEWEDS